MRDIWWIFMKWEEIGDLDIGVWRKPICVRVTNLFSSHLISSIFIKINPLICHSWCLLWEGVHCEWHMREISNEYWWDESLVIIFSNMSPYVMCESSHPYLIIIINPHLSLQIYIFFSCQFSDQTNPLRTCVMKVFKEGKMDMWIFVKKVYEQYHQ